MKPPFPFILSGKSCGILIYPNRSTRIFAYPLPFAKISDETTPIHPASLILILEPRSVKFMAASPLIAIHFPLCSIPACEIFKILLCKPYQTSPPRNLLNACRGHVEPFPDCRSTAQAQLIDMHKVVDIRNSRKAVKTVVLRDRLNEDW